MSTDHVDPDDTGLRFALQVVGAEPATTPPHPDSPLARLRRFAAADPGVTLRGEHIGKAVAGTLEPEGPERGQTL